MMIYGTLSYTCPSQILVSKFGRTFFLFYIYIAINKHISPGMFLSNLCSAKLFA